jgi:hypothetical protein
VDGGGGAITQPSADWAERWQTKPEPNDPATISVCVDDLTPRVGQQITVSLVGQDPDAVILDNPCARNVRFEGEPPPMCREPEVSATGPRPTPPQRAGRLLHSAKHTYTSAGARTIVGSVTSAEWNGYTEPYSSSAAAQITVTVHA